MRCLGPTTIPADHDSGFRQLKHLCKPVWDDLILRLPEGLRSADKLNRRASTTAFEDSQSAGFKTNFPSAVMRHFAIIL